MNFQGVNFKDVTKFILDEAKVSQYELAELCGVKQATINRIRNGVTPMPYWETGERLLSIKREIEDGNFVHPRSKQDPNTAA